MAAKPIKSLGCIIQYDPVFNNCTYTKETHQVHHFVWWSLGMQHHSQGKIIFTSPIYFDLKQAYQIEQRITHHNKFTLFFHLLTSVEAMAACICNLASQVVKERKFCREL